MALEEFKAVSEKFHSLFQLKPPTDINASQEKRSKAMVQSQELLESFHAKPLNEKVYQVILSPLYCTLLFRKPSYIVIISKVGSKVDSSCNQRVQVE